MEGFDGFAPSNSSVQVPLDPPVRKKRGCSRVALQFGSLMVKVRSDHVEDEDEGEAGDENEDEDDDRSRWRATSVIVRSMVDRRRIVMRESPRRPLSGRDASEPFSLRSRERVGFFVEQRSRRSACRV